MLLANKFEKFRDVCLDYYELDPFHYLNSPELSWDIMFKVRCVEIELISDVDMHHFYWKCMRDGASYIAQTYSKANNNKQIEFYDKNKPSNFIIYKNTNNLYEWAIKSKF